MKSQSQKFFPSDIAVCFSTDGIYLNAASYNSTGDIETCRLATGEYLFQSLKAWRENLGHRTDLQTVFRFVPQLFNEQTRIAALAEDVLGLDDRELTLWLIDAAKKHLSGEDGNPIFESTLKESLYDYARLPNGSITLTEIPRERLHEGLKQVMQSRILDPADLASLTRYVADDSQPYLLHAVETPLRAVTRHLTNEDSDHFRTLEENKNIAVFAFTPEGCGFALWNPQMSFYGEYGEWFNLNFDENEIPEDVTPADYVAELYIDSVYNFLHEQFYKRVVPEDGEIPEMEISRIYWTATDGLNTPLEKLFQEFGEQTLFSFVEVETPMEEMIVRGLLLAHETEAEALVPSINLANDISVQNESINAEVQNMKAVNALYRRRVAFACLMLPMVLALGLIVGLWVNNMRVAATLAWREAVATQEKNRLKPILEARASYENTLKWYEDVLRQIIALRQKQTSSLSFAARLDPLYPATNAFYVSDLKLAPGGAFELKGYTRNEMEVAEFVRLMEFSADDQEKRYFTGLQLEFKQGSKIAAANQISSAGGATGLSGNLAPGVSGFVLKGTFAPASVLIAQTPSANSPNPPKTAADPASPKPPATVTAPGSNTGVKQ